MKIWKYELKIIDIQTLLLPPKAEILSVVNHQEKLCLYALVAPANRPMEGRHIEIIGTGHTHSDHSRKYLGTVIIEPFVWHVYESTDRRHTKNYYT